MFVLRSRRLIHPGYGVTAQCRPAARSKSMGLRSLPRKRWRRRANAASVSKICVSRSFTIFESFKH